MSCALQTGRQGSRRAAVHPRGSVPNTQHPILFAPLPPSNVQLHLENFGIGKTLLKGNLCITMIGVRILGGEVPARASPSLFKYFLADPGHHCYTIVHPAHIRIVHT